MTIFSKIINGEIPCYKIYEDELTFAFLDINPIRKGHILVVPKIEIDSWLEIPEEYYLAVYKTARILAPAIQQFTGSDRIGQHVEGFLVPYFHLHLVPLFDGADFFAKDNFEASPENFAAVQEGLNKLILK